MYRRHGVLILATPSEQKHLTRGAVTLVLGDRSCLSYTAARQRRLVYDRDSPLGKHLDISDDFL
jgi:hypothetical protein